jgi:hypothetical protein
MLYNSTRPRAIMMRSAKRLWGPWSEAAIIFNPFRDEGYGHFMHVPSNFKGVTGDSFHDPKRPLVWGGEYGPYLMTRYMRGDAGQCRIYYTMSTWNPYQVVIMRSDFRLASESTGPGSDSAP